MRFNNTQIELQIETKPKLIFPEQQKLPQFSFQTDSYFLFPFRSHRTRTHVKIKTCKNKMIVKSNGTRKQSSLPRPIVGENSAQRKTLMAAGAQNGGRAQNGRPHEWPLNSAERFNKNNCLRVGDAIMAARNLPYNLHKNKMPMGVRVRRSEGGETETEKRAKSGKRARVMAAIGAAMLIELMRIADAMRCLRIGSYEVFSVLFYLWDKILFSLL